MNTKSRRRVLKGVGLALPAAWARPVVESVLLPAHANTSAIPDSGPIYSFTCLVFDIRELPDLPGVAVDFSYTPIDSSGALNGQQVDTIYTAFDANDNIIFGPQLVTNSWFGIEAAPAFPVADPLPPTPYTVMVVFGDGVTYGPASCSSSSASLP